MQALKAMVILMGVLIVGAIAVLSYGLMNDWHKKKVPEEANVSEEPMTIVPAATTANLPTRLGEFENWMILLPSGAAVVEMTPESNILYIRYQLADSAGGILVLDLAQQKQIGHIQY